MLIHNLATAPYRQETTNIGITVLLQLNLGSSHINMEIIYSKTKHPFSK